MHKLLDAKVLFCVFVALCGIGITLLAYTYMGYRAGAWGKFPIAGSAVLVLGAFAIFVRLILQWKGSPEKVFLLVGTPALVAFASFMLLGHVPDEMAHIWRMFDLIDSGTSMEVPTAILDENYPLTYAEQFEVYNTAIPWSETTIVDWKDMSAYLPHLYLLPGILVKGSSFLGVNLFVSIWLARLVNVALYLVAGYWIIKLMPLAKTCTFVYLLNPMILQQEASCSADAITNIACLLYVAFVFKVRFSDEIKRVDLVFIGVTFVFAALSKFVYALLLFMLLILVPKLEGKRKRIGAYIGFAACLVIGFVGIMAILPHTTYSETYDLIMDPHELVWVMRNTFYENGPGLIQQFLGLGLGWFDVIPFAACFMIYGALLLFSLVFNLGEEHSLKRSEKIIVAVLFAVIVVAVIVIMRGWSIHADNNYHIITGPQGRYFLPVTLSLLCCFITPRSSLQRKNCLLVYSSILSVIYLFDIYAMILRFA